jgi:hypothetical protein
MINQTDLLTKLKANISNDVEYHLKDFAVDNGTQRNLVADIMVDVKILTDMLFNLINDLTGEES